MKRISPYRLRSPVDCTQYTLMLLNMFDTETYDIEYIEDLLQIIAIHFLDVGIVRKASSIIWKISNLLEHKTFMLDNGCFSSCICMLRHHSKDPKTLFSVCTAIGTSHIYL
jgi:hypothetical protein